MRTIAPQWHLQAACREHDPEIWYPDYTGPVSTIRAKTVCRECPVRVNCLLEALATGEDFGIWGGTTPQERKNFNRYSSARQARLLASPDIPPRPKSNKLWKRAR